MTTSNSTNYYIDARECIELAFSEINVIGEADQLSDYDAGRGKSMLNMMLKHWQSQDHHLWVKQTITLFLQKSQNTYSLSQSSSDHATADAVVQTQLTADFTAGVSLITVTSTSGIVANDYIGIKLNDNSLFWTTVSSIPVAGSIVLSDVLPYAASTSSVVFAYRNKLDTPFQIYSAVRSDYVSKIDVPLNYMSYREYQDMPNKLGLGAVTQWAADRQVDTYKLFTWLSPNDVNYYLRVTLSRRIQDIDVMSNTFDLPQEWQLAIVKNLAVLLAPGYGKAQGDNFMELKLQAKESLEEAKGMDTEMGSIYIKPNFSGFRR